MLCGVEEHARHYRGEVRRRMHVSADAAARQGTDIPRHCALEHKI